MRKIYSGMAAGVLVLGLVLGGGAATAQAGTGPTPGPSPSSWPPSTTSAQVPEGYVLEQTYSLFNEQACENDGAAGVRAGRWRAYLCRTQAYIVNILLAPQFVTQLWVQR